MDIIKNYNKIKNAVFLIDGGEFCFERDLIQVFNRSQRHHSVAVDLLKVFGLQESFRVAATVKLQEGAKPKHMYFVYRITMEYIGLKYTMYESGNAQIVTDENWVTLTAKYDIPPEATVIEFICYIFQLEVPHGLGNENAIMELLIMYRPMLLKESIIDDVFDEDLYQKLCIVFLRCIKRFRI